MAEYTRTYPDAPTPDEIKQGYAPSTIRRTPFVKFLFWTFAGLVVSYAIGYGTLVGLSNREAATDQAKYGRSAARLRQDFTGTRLQPSPGHDTLDWEDMQALTDRYRDQLQAKGLWMGERAQYKSGVIGKPVMADRALQQTAAALQQWNAQAGAGGAAKKAPDPNDQGK